MDMNTQDTAPSSDVKHHLHPMGDATELRRDGSSIAEKAAGATLTVDGRVYIDGLSGLACVNIGYGNETVCDAASRAMRCLSYAHSFGTQSNRDAALLASKLFELTDGRFDKFFFGTSGSDAIESAIKIAYYYWRRSGEPGRRVILSREHSYHGNTIVATSLTGIGHYHEQFGLPLRGMVRHISTPYWYRYGRGRSPEEVGAAAAASLEHAIIDVGPENIAAFIGEPIQVTGGVIIPPANYWPEIQRICSKYDVLFIADEVVTGFGKVGTMFAYQRFGFVPDILVLAKGLTSGYYPMSSVGIDRKVTEVFDDAAEEFVHGFTYCAHPVGAAVALANIGVIEGEGLVQRVKGEVERRLAAGLVGLSRHRIVGDVRSMGVLGAVEFEADDGSEAGRTRICDAVIKAVRSQGVIARAVGGTLVLALPMIITDAQIDEVIRALDAGIVEVMNSLSVR